jgi:DNA mismatch repair protein MutS
MQQYLAVKKQHPSALLLFRLGDFYELFYDDAILASRELQITLTSRNKEKGQPIPMCGVPYHAAESYIARLIRAGHKVAICEQMEEPGPGKKLVRREVVRVLTPGTATQSSLVEAKENNFLAAVVRCAENGSGRQKSFTGMDGSPSAVAGLAYLDLSTGEFRATEFGGDSAESRLRDELGILQPREILSPQVGAASLKALLTAETNGSCAVHTRLDDWIFDSAYASRQLESQFKVAALEGFGLTGHALATAAAGAIVHYLRETSAISPRAEGRTAVLPGPAGTGVAVAPEKAPGLEHLDRIVYYEQQNAMVLDQVTVRNLELVEPAVNGDRRATLLDVIDQTCTGMGARLLRAWLLRPEIDIQEIEQRLDAVAALKTSTVAREEIRRELDQIRDLERLTSKVTLGSATPRDLIGIRESLERIPRFRQLLASEELTAARLGALREALEEPGGVRDLIARGISDDPPAVPRDPGMIRRGFNAELDELRDILKQGRQFIASMEERERRRTGIASLKIRYNQVFGYYIEVSKANLDRVPADFERKQTLVNAERFTSGELKEHERKVLSAEERTLEIERRIYQEVCRAIADQAAALRRVSAAVAQLDVLANFARLAAARNYTRPEFTERSITKGPKDKAPRGEMLVAGARHPVIESLLEARGERFVPNDLYFGDDSPFLLLITGPNMGGKSTYLRQAALVSILAQAGSFVPALQARLPLFDRIFTRIGASDNLARGRSTFLVEMNEVAAILNTATPASLILLDEVGRGTATFDGLSIAWAVVEALGASGRPRTLFATHYHELTELEQLLPGVKNLHVAVEEAGSEIIFMRKVEPGSADKSYGIEVARLAGLPRSVIERAREILRKHERSEEKLTAELSVQRAIQQATGLAIEQAASDGISGTGISPSPIAQQTSFAAINDSVLKALREAELNALTPLEALNLLAALQKDLQ